MVDPNVKLSKESIETHEINNKMKSNDNHGNSDDEGDKLKMKLKNQPDDVNQKEKVIKSK